MRRDYLGMGIGLLGFGVVTGLVLSREPSLGEKATQYMQCLDRADAGCLMQFATPEEQAATGLNEATLKQFLNDFVAPRLAGSRNREKLRQEAGDTNGLSIIREYKLQDGRTVSQAFGFYVVDGKARASVLWPLLMLCYMSDPVDVGGGANSFERQVRMLHAKTRAYESLEKLDLKGYAWVISNADPVESGITFKRIMGLDARPPQAPGSSRAEFVSFEGDLSSSREALHKRFLVPMLQSALSITQ